jgi:glutathione S-transferase
MMILYTPESALGIPNIVPAGLKLETWLRMAAIPYEVAPPDLSLAPKGKLPFVRIDGEIMGDSTFIIERLTRKHGKDLDERLNRQERAVSLAFRRMIKENLYWVITHVRWAIDANFALYQPVVKRLFLAGLPPEQQDAVCAGLRQQMLSQFVAQGMGKHSPEEVAQIGIADLQAISDYLDQKPFFMGDQPTVVDATLFGYLVNLLDLPFDSPIIDFGRSKANLAAYRQRMRDRFFP